VPRAVLETSLCRLEDLADRYQHLIVEDQCDERVIKKGECTAPPDSESAGVHSRWMFLPRLRKWKLPKLLEPDKMSINSVNMESF
jgi:hypothetical protein